MTRDGPDPDLVYRIDVEVSTPVHPTEVEDRVREAVQTIVPGASLDKRDSLLVATTHSLDRFSERLREQEIVDSAREVFFQSRQGQEIAFDLKKQAAYQGVVNFAVGSPAELGDLHVRVRVEEPDVETFIDWLAPATDMGDRSGDRDGTAQR